MNARAERLSQRWMRKQAATLDSDAVAEVFTVRIQGASVEDHIKAFTSGLIRDGQKINKIVEAAVKQVEGYYPPDKMDPRRLRVAVKRIIRVHWGNDKMLGLLADMLAWGEYIY